MPAPYTSRTSYRVATSHGDLHVDDSGGDGPPLLMLHGNSSSCQVFARQLASPLPQTFRLIAFDLPGHGRSQDAISPARTYSRSGLADCALELLSRLGLRRAAALGWSLGGHVAIEMVARFDGLTGLVLTGTPPVRPGRMGEGFMAPPAYGLPGRARLTPAEVERFAAMMFGGSADAFLLEAIARTDERFRPQIFEAARTGDGADQRRVVEAAPFPQPCSTARTIPSSGWTISTASRSEISGVDAATGSPASGTRPSGARRTPSTPCCSASFPT